MTTDFVSRNPRILILNPNSSHDMTHAMAEAIRGLTESLDIYTYTAPRESPASINDGKDLESSTEAVMLNLIGTHYTDVTKYDGIIIACYSVHPLVQKIPAQFGGNILVTGIFEASILTSLSLISPYSSANSDSQAWGIVTTGKFWESHLAEGVKAFLSQDSTAASSKFAGVYSTGLNAGDFHGDVPPEVIREKLKGAAKKLLASAKVGCVVMGCAGMAGLEEIIRDAAVEEYGQQRGNRVCIIDGVKASVGLMEKMIQNKRMFQK